MNKEVIAHKRAEVQARLDTLKFAFGNPGANLDPLLTDAARDTVKKIKRLDIENQIKAAQDDLKSFE